MVGVSVSPAEGVGQRLAERLGLKITGTEGHDLKGPCIDCQSSDAFRVHQDKGVAHCFSCGAKWSAFCLAEDVIGHDPAIRLMVELGIFKPREGNGKPADDTADPIAEVARQKNVSAESLKRYGAFAKNGKIHIPMFGPSDHADPEFTWVCCSHQWLDPKQGGKGLNTKGKPVGVFLPCDDGKPRIPQAGETWYGVEGPKDAAALSDLGYLAFGLPTNQMNKKFTPLLTDVDVVLIPDADEPGRAGAMKTAKRLQCVARSVKMATLPTDIQPTGGEDVRDILKRANHGEGQVRRAIDEAQLVEQMETPADGGKLKRLVFTAMTCAQLMAADLALEYLIDGLLVAGQPCILAGPKKSLKTTLLLDLVLSLAMAGYFLGRFPVASKKRVGVMTGESGLATIQETIARIADASGIDPYGIENLLITESVPRFGVPAYDLALRSFIESNSIEVLVVDPVYMCIDGEGAGNLFHMGDNLRAPSEICRELGTTLVLAHHTRKNIGHDDPYRPPELEDIAWAGFQEFARQWLLVNRREKYEPGTGEHKLWLSAGGSAGHSSLHGIDVAEGVYPDRFWDVTVQSAGDVQQATVDGKAVAREQRDAEKMDEARMAIVKAMVAKNEPATCNSIRDLSGLGKGRFSPAFTSLVSDRTVRSVGEIRGGNGRSYEAYTITEGADHET